MQNPLHTPHSSELCECVSASDKQQCAAACLVHSLSDSFLSKYIQSFPDIELFPVLKPISNATHNGQEHVSTLHHQNVPPTTENQSPSTDARPAKQVNIFISYVKEDRKMLETLQKHLRVMQRQLERRNFVLTIWHSGQVIPGQDWKGKIEHYLSTAHIILLLVSIDFLDSELCYAIQIQPALDRHLSGMACVIPIILRPCDWEEERFGPLQPLPTDGIPVVNWPICDEAYKDIITGVRRAIANLPP